MPLTSETSRWKVGENALNGRKTVGNGGQRGGMDFSYSLFGRVRDSRHSSNLEIGVRRKWVTKRKKKKEKKGEMPRNFCNAIVPPTDPSLFLTGSRGPPKNKRAARELNPAAVVFTADE